jgi:hypothetical protein
MLADSQQQRLLERLREAGEQPVAFGSCMPAGLTSRPPSCASSIWADTRSSASMITVGWLGCACSSQNPSEHPPRPAPAALGAPIASSRTPGDPRRSQRTRLSRSRFRLRAAPVHDTSFSVPSSCLAPVVLVHPNGLGTIHRTGRLAPPRAFTETQASGRRDVVALPVAS